MIGPGVVVEEGAEIRESLLFGDTVVRSGARVTRSIVDTGCELLDGADIGGDQVALDDPDAIPIVGRDSRVGSAQPAGSRLPPGRRSETAVRRDPGERPGAPAYSEGQARKAPSAPRILFSSEVTRSSRPDSGVPPSRRPATKQSRLPRS